MNRTVNKFHQSTLMVMHTYLLKFPLLSLSLSPSSQTCHRRHNRLGADKSTLNYESQRPWSTSGVDASARQH